MTDLWGFRLPAIQRKVQELLRATEGELSELPNEPSKDPVGGRGTEPNKNQQEWASSPVSAGRSENIRPCA